MLRYLALGPFRVILLAAAVLVALTCNMAQAGWVPAGGNWYFWQNPDGSYDGWWYWRSQSYGGHQFAKHSRYAAQETSSYSSGNSLASYGWRDKVVGILAERQSRRARIEEAAVDHSAFLETIRATGLTLPDLNLSMPGYGGGLGAELGQQTIYGQVTAPLADAFRNFDAEARLAQLQRLDEQVAAGQLQMTNETRRTLREAIKTYEHLKGTEIRKDAAAGTIRELRELLNRPKPAAEDPPPIGDGSPPLSLKEAPIAGELAGVVPGLVSVVSANCLECHGPTRAEKGLRLDKPDVFVAHAKDIVARVFSNRADYVMPPPASRKTLTGLQKAAFALGKP